MNLKSRLIIINFLQFFVWGAWMMTLGKYAFGVKHWDSGEFGIIFSTMGFASLIMPALCGIVADRWVKSNLLFALLHLLFGLTLCFLPLIDNAWTFFAVMLLAMCFYMPSIALNNSIGFELLLREGKNPQQDFPPIRVWGTVGFIAAMWITNIIAINFPNVYSLEYWSGYSFILGASGAFALALFAFFGLPDIRPENKMKDSKSWVDKLGLQAFSLFKDYKMALFFVFSILLGAALQLTNAYGDEFIGSLDHWFTREYSTIILSVSQISETLFILSIPFFMRRFGIKNVMLISMFAWMLRFALFGVAGPDLWGIAAIFLSCIVYGMAFDFFNISGALFVEKATDEKIRNSAQGVFMMMTNGVGAVLGNISAGYAIKFFFTDAQGNKEWPAIWFTFAVYALVVGLMFAVLFKHKHRPEDFEA